VENYLKRVGIALSVLLNVLLGGYSNQTFSARNHDWKRRGKPNLAWLIDFVFLKLFNDDDHCLAAWIYWNKRKTVELKIQGDNA